ncbi:hypothetical protein PRUPE_3G110000 [Prunus persica]|uniref:F-box domain-containing protein n=1 Tax=Prunus persica TaxID=3760 RepID=M5WW84_PRUPE|nr:F-box/kelch-repeat protein At3g06240 [Prunus persica]ONI16608.1 hypothetical protein PRUPE_3G110000 [Prunus persica]ONI16609.1 hypothetical protein PRUPE_3G110000 [Prunus persica]ONI16610.1 hypothetical protein PRUPE_3G110000 [Prunus persica]ONI16611.1 hypothetical protein PRUPE_3G110000 [Prunus persica]ONI16612.1 hypothetical protein PRUPE_3G110000 [Prunus persica]
MAFPEHLTADILSRLPAKSLVRFSSVRKEWQALIRDPHFISQHLNLNIAKEDQSGRLLVKYRCNVTRKNVISLLLHGTHGYMLSKLEIPSSVMDSHHLKLVGSCNGLLCLAHDKSAHLWSPMILLWNPAIREFSVLPDSVIDSVNDDDNVQARGIAHGFGYHPLIDDYKVVRIVSLSCFGNAWIRAEVYSSKMDCWQEVNTFHFEIYEHSCTALNGLLYWIAYGKGDRELIVSFDMCDDVFGELQLPDLSFLDTPMCTKLAELKQSLYLIVYTFSGRQREIYVWKMIEHDAEVFWKREWTIGPLLGIERPLGCGLYGEIYMESRKGDLVLYNPSSEEAKHIPICGLRCSLEVHFYVESLVSTKGQREVLQETNKRIM